MSPSNKDEGHAPVGASAGAFRQEILDVLGRLLRESTLDDLRIAQILKAAKVSRGTFYFYYASKEDAFAALLDQVYARAVPAFEALFADPATRRPEQLREGIAGWLNFGDGDAAVFRTAIEEWPRHAGIREIHLGAQRRLSGAVTKRLEDERKNLTSTLGVPAATLGSALVWTLERAWYEAGTDADSAHGLADLNAALAATITSSIYGAA
ncbi:TetR/AcrR family transcriptional regulator [Sporichthya sp.]|uniref:TetR/AcrR family transcriptional regulator n=1 Tax=Sporichthya sp. TaxID=65475 RepID=UPI00180EFD1C|nr:TetR/AcrR family transcriptional regulator [Sporichthya sp.]MBA3744361.1 TetR/AcrR family transcriptional regulator [Sporichthya sp.]